MGNKKGVLLLAAVMMSGCGSSTPPTAVATQTSPQEYLTPVVAGSINLSGGTDTTQTTVFDDVAKTFSQSTHELSAAQQGSQIINAGVVTKNSRSLLSLGLTAHYVLNNNSVWVATDYNPPLYPPRSGGFALELASQAGGFIQLQGQPATPFVPTTQCPSISTPQTYQFLSIPGPLLAPSATRLLDSWNPLSETAFGRVDISTSGSTVNLANISQSTLGGGTPTNPSAASVAGVCGLTAYGNAMSVPGQVVVTNPGPPATNVPQAIFSIGPSGLLVEDNGYQQFTGTQPPSYQNALGAGTGAVGLPRPSAALDTGALVGAQYLGFIYGAGVASAQSSAPTGWSSHLASFGFSSVPSTCFSVTANTGTLIYGGDFTNDDPTTSTTGFGNCDFAVDLGGQDSTNHGLYLNAKVYMGASYAANTTHAAYSFPAVAIAGQLQGKFALFVLGVDSKQPWEIDLLQSN